MKYIPLFLALLLSCSSAKKTGSSASGETGSASGGTRHLVLDGKLWSSLFQQRAAEYKALCLQAFNIARFRLDEAVRQNSQAKPLAVITDIDETFLDNSPNSVHQALLGKDFEPAAWNEWTEKGVADTLPGALAFFNYAASLHITVFYITNRDEKDKPGTLKNLQKFHFPFSDNEHLIVKQTESSKEERRQKVMSGYQVVLLLGDNLGDFSALFERKSEAERAYNVNQLAGEFGKRFIVLPNANYGGWEDAIYENKRTWTLAQKDSIIRAKLTGY